MLHNKIILPGAGFTARSHFDLPRNEITPSYNTALGLENTVIETPDSLEKVFLFCVGTDGCGRENSDVFDVNYAKWITPDALIPFRYVPQNEDLDITLREKYFGRVLVGNRVAYYFKAFDIDPIFKAQFIDGTPIDEHLYDSDNVIDVEVFVEMKMSITKRDCRDYFIAHSGINDAKVNTISLCVGYPKEYNGHVYYQGLRSITRLNFPNESLIDQTKGIDIIYDLFF